MTKILTFSYNTPIADDKNVRFAVSRQSFQGGRAFVVQTSKSLAKERKVFNTNLKTNVDALNEVEQVRVKCHGGRACIRHNLKCLDRSKTSLCQPFPLHNNFP